VIDPTTLAVDIVVDNYNYRRFVAEAVESALHQTHPVVRVIVVDDGSTDGSQELLRGYGARVELVLKDNGGQASALNAGFARSRGDVVIFLDADDLLRPGAAALAASVFAAAPEVVRVQYRMEVIDADGLPTRVVKPASHLPLLSGDLRRAELVFPFDLVWLRNGATAFRADSLRRILPMPEHEFAQCADWYLVHLTTLLGPVVSLEEIGACYRIHGGNRYEQQQPNLDLEHVRQTIGYAAVTTRALERLGDELGLTRPHPSILSVSDIANRLISLRLEPALHPVAEDRRWPLVTAGARAAARRFDVGWAMKLLFVCWFAAAGIAPRALTRGLGELFLFPERRARLNRLLAHLHLGPPERGGQEA
jgi:hypothetical protein